MSLLFCFYGSMKIGFSLPCHIFIFIIHLFLSVALTFPDDFIFRFFPRGDCRHFGEIRIRWI